MIDFDTKNIILVCYPPWAGGKFLINCLGLNNNAFFQHRFLAEKQLSNNFNVDDKMTYLRTKIQHADKNAWGDLGLGCLQFFRFPTDELLIRPIDKLNELFDEEFMQRIISSNNKFFLVSHHDTFLINLLDVWENATVIIFKNCDKFVTDRTSYEPHKIDLSNIKIKNTIYEWDNNLYYSEDVTVKEIKKLYENLNLQNFPENYIREYYKLWINKI